MGRRIRTKLVRMSVDDNSCSGSNDSGIIVVDLSNLPNATGEGSPANSYGFIRFRVSVD